MTIDIAPPVLHHNDDPVVLRQRIAELEAQLSGYQQAEQRIRTIFRMGPTDDVLERLNMVGSLLDTSLDAIGLANIDGTVVYANPAHRTMSGRGEGAQIQDYYLPEDFQQYQTETQPRLLREGRVEAVSRMLRPDGSTWQCLANTTVLYNEAGEPQYFAAIFRDMTAQQAQEARLRTFEALAEYAPDGISLSNLEGQFVYANPSFKQMTGFGEDVFSKTIFETYAEDAAHLGAAAQQVVEQGFWQGTLTYRRPDGTTFPGAVSVFLIRNLAGQPQYFGAVARDISEQHRAEAERLALQEQIISAQQAALAELSTPLIPLAEGLVVMPLVGSIDSNRAQQIVESLLQGVAENRASTVILDITGVPVVDTQVANALLRAAQAVKLLGARVALTGIRPEVAQTIVGLGVDLSGITTHGSLQNGIASALKK